MDIKFYKLDERSLPIQAGKKDRDWFDSVEDQKFYYDLTLIMANQSGWVLKSTCDFSIEWNGGTKSTDMLVYSNTRDFGIFSTGMGHGICSVSTGYVIRTPEDYGILLTGVPNLFKENIHVMTSLIESDWTHTPYFINMKMTKPGKVDFKKNEPLGFVTVVPHKQLENFELQVDTILKDPELYKQYVEWSLGSTNHHKEPFRLNRKLKTSKRVFNEKKT